MPIGSVICRRNLDEERANPWICACPLCEQERKNQTDERVLHGDGVGRSLRSQPQDDLSKAVGQGDTGFQSR